jgi:AraC-like DNA-binding protein
MANVWIYDDKSIFLDRASGALLFASLVYIGMNMVILFFPHIMYGLPIGLKLNSKDAQTVQSSESNLSTSDVTPVLLQEVTLNPLEKMEPQLFTLHYRETIEATLESCKARKLFLNTDFKLIQISNESGIPPHHLTYFFNDIIETSFTDWRNGLRIAHAKNLISEGKTDTYTLQAISLQCGFASQNTFIRAFKNDTGITPSKYMKSLS